jgi:deoxyadenosine/deoxycytidine kinase
MTKLISIEGNIFSGKGELFEDLKARFRYDNSICFIELPREEWFNMTDKDNTNIVNLNANEPHRYSFEYHLHVLNTIYTATKRALDARQYRLIVSERSIYTCKSVFLTQAINRQEVTFLQYQLYCSIFQGYANDLPLHGFIFLRTSPKISLFLSHMYSKDETIENITKYNDNYEKGLSENISSKPHCILNGSDFLLDASTRYVVDQAFNFLLQFK